MKFQSASVFLFCFVALTVQQSCSYYPGCVDCRWRPNPCGMYCAEYLCNTIACGKCSNNTCTACVEGYIISGKECQECQTGCSECIFDRKENLTCNNCFDGYYLHNKNNSCLSCYSFMDNCQSCNTTQDNEPYCSLCDYTYALNGEKVCEACPTGTQQCQWDTKKNKFVALACDTYNSYYLDNSTQECTLCPENCQYCQQNNSQVICTQCNFASTSGFINKQGRCQEPSSIDVNCITAGYNKEGQLKCQSCTDGYVLNQKSNTCRLEQCTEITQNCAKCSYSQQYVNNTYQNVKICETCEPGYIQNTYGGECIKTQISNCISFNNKTSCYQCANGYYLNGEGTECVSVKDPIPHCLYGYLANDNKQVLCSACEGQNSQDPNSVYLNPGYFVTYNNLECKQCPQNCSFCSLSESEAYCVTCSCGYMQVEINYEYVCKKIDIPNCENAAAYGLNSEKLQCIKCIKGYYGVNGACKKIQKNILATIFDYFKD